MPELPEVETTCRGIRPHVERRSITAVEVRNPSLRVPVSDEVGGLAGEKIISVSRRAKYILIECTHGQLLIHLGMSGSLRITEPNDTLKKHDHVIIQLDSGMELRYHDPRRFGLVIWVPECSAVSDHPLLRNLGPEPLDDEFSADLLSRAAKGRKIAIKLLIMNNAVVVGVGNIYACEALFIAGIHPGKIAAKVTKPQIAKLVEAIKNRLELAINHGGTTLRDFVGGTGEPGYFKQELNVYGREGEDCRVCATNIKRVTLGQRSTFFCPKCQRQ